MHKQNNYSEFFFQNPVFGWFSHLIGAVGLYRVMEFQQKTYFFVWNTLQCLLNILWRPTPLPRLLYRSRESVTSVFFFVCECVNLQRFLRELWKVLYNFNLMISKIDFFCCGFANFKKKFPWNVDFLNSKPVLKVTQK